MVLKSQLALETLDFLLLFLESLLKLLILKDQVLILTDQILGKVPLNCDFIIHSCDHFSLFLISESKVINSLIILIEL